jgi:hypothetical protein
MGLTLRETPLDPRLTRCEPLGYRVFSNTKRKNTPLSLLMLSRPFRASVCLSLRTPVSGDRCRRNKQRRQIMMGEMPQGHRRLNRHHQQTV